jgi:alanine racemase
VSAAAAASAAHPTRVVVDLDAIAHNVRLIKGLTVGGAAVLAVVKANAYGHGATAVARTALRAGAAWCGVATLAEGVALRESGITAPILVMGYTPAPLAADALAHDLRLTVYDRGVAEGLARAAAAAEKPCRVHVKIDTGMGRLGVLPDDARAFVAALLAMKGLVVDGLFTHFSCSEGDAEYTREQIRRFERATTGIDGPVRHACNSGGVFGFPEAHFDLVRPGLTLYGMSPYDAGREPAAIRQLRPALRWRSEVASVKTLPHGAPVGYSQRYRCEGERRIAVIPVGYGDGMRRTPHNAGEVLVRGQRAPICGTVCMDQCMIDVTHIDDVALGDEVVLIGTQGAERISADEVAVRTGTINYEVTTALLARPAREYVGGAA